ncbi:hypothetical protein NL676_004345 [Syzygium grande]|nr:hypothetical protein NL676_004345 [Syzygium grande]
MSSRARVVAHQSVQLVFHELKLNSAIQYSVYVANWAASGIWLSVTITRSHGEKEVNLMQIHKGSKMWDHVLHCPALAGAWNYEFHMAIQYAKEPTGEEHNFAAIARTTTSIAHALVASPIALRWHIVTVILRCRRYHCPSIEHQGHPLSWI